MARETSPQAPSANEPQRPGRRSIRSLLLLGCAAVTAVATGSLWITGVGTGTRVAAAGTAGTPAPAPVAGAAATPSGGMSGTVSALANPAGPHNLLLSANGSLDTTVTTYSDCSGGTELTHSAAAIDTCV